MNNPHCSAPVCYAATRYDTNDVGQGLNSTQPFVPRKEERARCNIGCKYAHQLTYTIKAEVALKQSTERDPRLSLPSTSHSYTWQITSKCYAWSQIARRENVYCHSTYEANRNFHSSNCFQCDNKPCAQLCFGRTCLTSYHFARTLSQWILTTVPPLWNSVPNAREVEDAWLRMSSGLATAFTSTPADTIQTRQQITSTQTVE